MKSKFLIYQKIIFSAACMLFVFVFQYSNVDKEPIGGDTFQYWYLATHLSISDNYGFLDQEDNDKSDIFNPLNNGGIRRGEILYPLFVSKIINLTTTDQQLKHLNSDCIYSISTEACSELTSAVLIVNYLFLSLKMLTIFVISLMFFEKIKKRRLIFVAIVLSASFPYTDKDLLTFIFLLAYFLSFMDSGSSKKYLILRHTSLALLPLTNPIFLYYLFFHFLIDIILIVLKRDKIKISLFLVLLSFIPSLAWSFRNYNISNNFAITARGSETIGIRAEALSLENLDIPAGLLYYTPSSRISNIMKGYLWNKVGTDNWESKFNRQSDTSFYRLGHSKQGYVFQKMKENLNYQFNENITFKDIVNNYGYNFATTEYRAASFELINENKMKYIGTSFMFLYRGLFPEINQLKQEITTNFFGNLIKELFLILRFLPIIYCFYILLEKISSSIFELQNYLFLFIYFSYGMLTHFIPRYSVLLIPFSIYLIINNDSKNLNY